MIPNLQWSCQKVKYLLCLLHCPCLCRNVHFSDSGVEINLIRDFLQWFTEWPPIQLCQRSGLCIFAWWSARPRQGADIRGKSAKCEFDFLRSSLIDHCKRPMALLSPSKDSRFLRVCWVLTWISSCENPYLPYSETLACWTQPLLEMP